MTTTEVGLIDRRLLSRVSNKIRRGKDHNDGQLDPDIVRGSTALKELAAAIPQMGSESMIVRLVQAGFRKAFPAAEPLSTTTDICKRLVEIGDQMLRLPELEPPPRYAILKLNEFISSTPLDNFARRRQ